MSEEKRDLTADLALCEKTTPGEWSCEDVEEGHEIWMGDYLLAHDQLKAHGKLGRETHHKIEYHHGCDFDYSKPSDSPVNRQAAEAFANAEFIAEAHAGWPHAIRRAEAAEAQIQAMRNCGNCVDVEKVAPFFRKETSAPEKCLTCLVSGRFSEWTWGGIPRKEPGQ